MDSQHHGNQAWRLMPVIFWEVKAGELEVHGHHPQLVSEFGASLVYKEPCLQTTKQAESSPLVGSTQERVYSITTLHSRALECSVIEKLVSEGFSLGLPAPYRGARVCVPAVSRALCRPALLFPCQFPRLPNLWTHLMRASISPRVTFIVCLLRMQNAISNSLNLGRSLCR